MTQMTSLFGPAWPWLLLAGVWSLGCGWHLRRAWTAAADTTLTTGLGTARDAARQLRAEADSARSQLEAIEADLVKQRSRVADVEASSAAELQMLSMKLASSGARAAGFDLANETSLKATAERERAVEALNALRQAGEAALADLRAQANAYQASGAKIAAELAAARNTWNIERSTLVDEHHLRLATEGHAHQQTLHGAEAEAETLAAEVARLTYIEAHADDLRARLELSHAALRAKENSLSALESRLLLLSPLPGRVAAAESELAALRRRLADRDAALARSAAELIPLDADTDADADSDSDAERAR